MQTNKPKLAIIGAGVAGIYAAYRLQKYCDVSLFESADYLGGHTNTIEVSEGPDKGACIDTGFIVLNDKTYPLLTAFLNELNVGIRYTDMSFSVHDLKTNLQYCSRNLNSLFAQRSNILNLNFLKMLLEIKRFWDISSEQLKSDSLKSQSLQEYLDNFKFSARFRNDFLYPLAAAVWSSSTKNLDKFPALTFLTFFRNHGWLSYADQPRWQTVVGGSYSYVKKFSQTFNGQIHLSCPVVSVQTKNSGIELLCSNGFKAQYDQLIFAVHADQVLKILARPATEQVKLFSGWKYSDNLTILHTDSSLMPPSKNAWASWNYRKELQFDEQQAVSVTYDMNNLQGLKTRKNYFVTLNPTRMPNPESIIRRFNYTHPIFDYNSINSQSSLSAINGNSGIWFCGSYCGYGFHEDAIKSADRVAGALINKLTC